MKAFDGVISSGTLSPYLSQTHFSSILISLFHHVLLYLSRVCQHRIRTMAVTHSLLCYCFCKHLAGTWPVTPSLSLLCYFPSLLANSFLYVSVRKNFTSTITIRQGSNATATYSVCVWTNRYTQTYHWQCWKQMIKLDTDNVELLPLM